MQYLKADTSVKVVIGPVVAVGDGFTPVTTLALGTADEAEILKHDAAAVTDISGYTFAAITSADGYYNLTIPVGGVDTEGMLTVLINDDSLCLPVRHDYMVVNANVFDSLYAVAATDYLQTDVTQWLGTAPATPTTAGVPEIELARISGQTVTAAAAVTVHSDLGVNSTAQAALEDQFDGTGLTGDTYPSTQAQIGAIGSATGGGLSFEATDDNVLGAIKSVTFVGVQTSGTFANTEAEDNIYHNITHTGNAIDIVYQFDIGGARTAAEILFKGYLSSSNDTMTVQMYDFVGADWETRGSIAGQGGTANASQTFKALSKHTGTAADLGVVLIRFVCTAQTAPDFFVDELICSGFSEGQSVGYEGGSVWIDTIDGVAGTESFVNGVADNPVLTLADAITIASNISLHRFTVSNDSSITFAESHTNEVWRGHGWTIALGGQDISGSHIHLAQSVTGTATTPTGECHILDSEIGNITIGATHFVSCGFDGTLTLSAATTYIVQNCYSKAAGTVPIVDFGAAVGNTTVNVRNWSGPIEFQNMGQLGTDHVCLDGHGTLNINANCTGGTLTLAGDWAVNNSGSVTITYDDQSQVAVDWTDGGRLDLILDDVLLDTGTSLPALIDDLAVKKNTAFNNFEFLMVLTSDHVTPATGLTVTGQRSIDGGAFASVGGAIAEVSNGIYQFDALAADTNGDVITWRFSSATADDTFVTFKTVA